MMIVGRCVCLFPNDGSDFSFGVSVFMSVIESYRENPRLKHESIRVVVRFSSTKFLFKKKKIKGKNSRWQMPVQWKFEDFLLSKQWNSVPLHSSSDDSSWHTDKFLLVTFMTYSKNVFGDHHHGIAGFSLYSSPSWLDDYYTKSPFFNFFLH